MSKKKKFIYTLATVVVLLIINYYINKNIEITNKVVVNNKLPNAFNGFTVVQISDFHNANFGENNSMLINKINSLEQVDIIVITGDLIDSRHTDVNISIDLVKELTKIAPTYYITGNHEFRIPEEYAILEKAMVENGVNVLKNSSVLVEMDNEFIQIIGVDDYNFFAGSETEVDKKVVLELQEKITTLNNKDLFSILLSHKPEFLNNYSESGVDLVFSGHTHGGQVKLPFIGGVLAPSEGFFPYFDGDEYVYESGETDMFISRGIGNSLFPIRINNRPEIIVAKLYNNSYNN